MRVLKLLFDEGSLVEYGLILAFRLVSSLRYGVGGFVWNVLLLLDSHLEVGMKLDSLLLGAQIALRLTLPILLKLPGLSGYAGVVLVYGSATIESILLLRQGLLDAGNLLLA